MSRGSDRLTMALQDLEVAEKQISVERRKTERIKVEAYRLLSQLSKQLIQSYYARQFIALDALFPYFSQKNAQKTNALYRKASVENNVPALTVTHLNHELKIEPEVESEVEPEDALDAIEKRFYGLKEAYRITGEILEEEKISEAENKEAKALHQQAEKLPYDYKAIALSASMLVGGLLLIAVTHGVAAAAGASLIDESIGKIRRLTESNANKASNAVANFDENTTELLRKLEETKTHNQIALNAVWIASIQTHCCKQQKSLAEMQSGLPSNDSMIKNMDQLSSEYQHHYDAIEDIKKISDEDKKAEALKNVAITIEKKEAHVDTRQIMHRLKEKLPDHLKSKPSQFLQRAKNFYHNNKKIMHFAALMALTITGIALTVTTGGVAGVLGAAILGAVAFKSSKSAAELVLQAKAAARPKAVALPKAPSVNTLLNDLIGINEAHCEAQAESTRIISAALQTDHHYPDVEVDLKHATEEFKDSAAALRELEQDNAMTPQDKAQKIEAITAVIQKTDQNAINALHEVGDNLHDRAKKESQKISTRAEKFYQDNKKIVHSVGKVMLSVAALTIVGVATGGVGVALALGFAATSWLIKATAEKIASIKRENAAHEDEREGESKQKVIKAEVIETKPVTGRH